MHLTKNNSRAFQKDLWIRCFAHVINLCVKSSLESMSTLIEKVKPFLILISPTVTYWHFQARNLVVSIRASPQRIAKFKKILQACGVQLQDVEYEEDELLCAEEHIIDHDLLSIWDFPTRWNSTFFILKRALKLSNALDEIAKNHDLRKNEIQAN